MSKPDHWIVQVIPAEGGGVHTYRIAKRALIVTASLSLLFVACSLAFLFGFLGRHHSAEEVARLRGENRHLRTGLRAMGARTERLTRMLDDLAARDQRYRLLAGLPLVEREVYDAGVGGPGISPRPLEAFYRSRPELASSVQATTMDLEQLLRRARLLAESLGEAIDSVRSQRDVFLSRPSIHPVASERSWVSSGFSRNRLHPLLGYRRPHEAIDISAPPGSPVVASARGRVVFVGSRPGYGRLVEIEHGHGYRTRYAHLSGVFTRRGKTVERGDAIGEVGRTGLATGPNLHYEVLVHGRAVNPREYLLDRSGEH